MQCGFCTPGLIVASHDLLRRNPRPTDPEIREALAGNLCRCTGYEKIIDAVRLAAGGWSARHDAHRDRGLRDRDDGRGRHRARRRPPRRSRTTASPRSARAPRPGAGREATRRIDGRGCLATPGLVNCHHHLYQWATRGLAQQATLFEWLVELYPVWAHIDDEIECGRGARRPRRARPLRLHDVDRPPLRLPATARRPARGRDRAPRVDRRALPPVPRLDGPRALRRRPAARRGRRGPRRDPRRQRGRDRPLPRPVARRDAARRARAVLAVLRHARAHGATPPSSPAAAACGCTPTSPRRSTRRTSAASGSACGPWSTSTTSAGSATTCGSRTAST